jgi:hypothetical protein
MLSRGIPLALVVILEYLNVRYGIRTGGWFIAGVFGLMGLAILVWGGVLTVRDLRRLRAARTAKRAVSPALAVAGRSRGAEK